MNANIPINHHYIPQFILRNFAYKEDRVIYQSVLTKKRSERYIKNTFSRDNLYKDKINNPDDPYKIEKDLSKFESEMGVIYKKILNAKSSFELTRDELNRFRLFLGVMAFRSALVKDDFTKVEGMSKELYKYFQKDENFVDFWKRNLGQIVLCRSIEEVTKSKTIDMPIKIFFLRDVMGFYMTVLERRGEKDFVISDAYPSVQKIMFGDGKGFKGLMPILYFFPISPSRIIVLRYYGSVLIVPNNKFLINPDLLDGPKPATNNLDLHYRIKKIYQSDVEKINNATIVEAKRGYIISKRNSDL